MSYQVLARKWRPATFEQVVGQSHVLHALTNALSQQRLHHAYLFTGTRGVGKTSLARLFAKGLNCEQGVTATPCGQCSSCVEIAQGRFVDLIEVDAASRTKVDDTREILDNVQYRPTRGRFKVYLIDEVHMLSRSSFNALLKTLEEPPEHVKFLLATTDPQKLPVTVLSRCLQFNLKSLTQTDIAAQLAHVLGQEQLPFETPALTLLAKAANGSMRDALSLTDQAIAFGAGQVMLTQVQTMLGSIDEQNVLALLAALTTGDVAMLMQTTLKVLGYGADPQEVLRSLLELLHQITLTQFAPAAAQMSLYSEQIQMFANELAPEQVQLYYQLLLNGRKDLPHAPDPKSGLEMALLRALAFTPDKAVNRWEVNQAASITLPAVSSTAASVDVAPDFATNSATDNQVKAALSSEQSAAGNEPLSPKLSVTAPDNTDKVGKVGNDNDLADDEAELNQSPEIAAELAALNAEQAIILSQAKSFGIADTSQEPHAQTISEQASVVASGTVQGTDSAPSRLSDLSDANSKIASDPSNALLEHNHPVSNHNSGVTTDLDASHYHIDNGNDDDDSGQFEDYQQYMAMDDSRPHEPVAPHVSVTGVEASASIPSEASGSVGATGGLEDDLLDAVLASRDALLSDLSRDAAKEGDGKKSLSESSVRKPFTPPTKATVELTSADLNNTDAPLGSDKGGTITHLAEQSMSTTPTVRPVPTNANAVDDRPPWEAASDVVVNSTPDFAAPHESKVSKESAVTKESSVAKESAVSDPQSASEPLSSDGLNDARIHSAATETLAEPHSALPQHETASSTAVAASGVVTSTASSAVYSAASSAITGDPLDLHWYKLMAQLDIGGRVRQLAVNSVCQRLQSPLPLLLKPEQKHLSAEVAVRQLEAALTQALGQETSVVVSFGTDPNHETPLEIRQRFHRELLSEAEQSLLTDENIQWMSQRLGAALDRDTLAYPQERLSLLAEGILSLTAQAQ